jgi:hypothetical protein
MRGPGAAAKALWSEPLACHAGVRAGIRSEERRRTRPEAQSTL